MVVIVVFLYAITQPCRTALSRCTGRLLFWHCRGTQFPTTLLQLRNQTLQRGSPRTKISTVGLRKFGTEGWGRSPANDPPLASNFIIRDTLSFVFCWTNFNSFDFCTTASFYDSDPIVDNPIKFWPPPKMCSRALLQSNESWKFKLWFLYLTKQVVYYK